MNRYTLLQKLLHRSVLSYDVVRRGLFDIERNLFPSGVAESEEHIFIAGLPRSGTTALLNAIMRSGSFSCLTYRDMPFVLAPNLWSFFSSNGKNVDEVLRDHADGVFVNIDSPEAFEEVFWMTACVGDMERSFKDFVSLVVRRYGRSRYISKNNQNIRRISWLSETFPDGVILIPFRDPLDQAGSLLSQHINFESLNHADPFIGEYMKLIGHREFGPYYQPFVETELIFENSFDLNHWLEQYTRIYTELLSVSPMASNVHFVNYERLCQGDFCEAGFSKVVKVSNLDISSFRRPKNNSRPEGVEENLEKSAYAVFHELDQRAI